MLSISKCIVSWEVVGSLNVGLVFLIQIGDWIGHVVDCMFSENSHPFLVRRFIS